MASAYPGGLDTFATNKANATATATDHPTHHNDLADAVNKIEAELGIDPAGAAATVVARLNAIAGGDVVFGDANSTAVAINSTSDVSIFSTNVASIIAGDLLEVEVWGFSRNSSGGNRTVTLTLDFDAAFDLEWPFTSVSAVQPFRIIAQLAVVATNLSGLVITGIQSAQTVAGTMTVLSGTGHVSEGYDTSTQDLTGTTAVTLVARSDSVTATQELTVLGLEIRKIAST